MGVIKEFRRQLQELQDDVNGVKNRKRDKGGKPNERLLHEARRRLGKDTPTGGLLARIFSCCARRAPVADQEANAGYVQDCTPHNKFTVDAERRPRKKNETEANATPPVEFKCQVPKDWEPGKPITVQGPHGPLWVEPPPNAQAGTSFGWKLSPPPDYKVEVPPDGKPGSSIVHRRSDGVDISFTVPKGAKPGNIFEVSPPSLMVQVPASCAPKDQVIFRAPAGAPGGKGKADEDSAEWFRARIPEGISPGFYFAARLPPPKEGATPVAGKRRDLPFRAKGA
jgi:hypothetical protein